ncbi:MAG TPA: glycosyl transferase, partial [Acetobacteraceae bacterium]|nr:glycosyl transferase [Acetobacteraceae bacterium]
SAWPGRFGRRLGIGGYVGAGVTLALVLLAIPLGILHAHGLGPAWLGLLGVLGVIPAIDLAVSLVNRAVTRGVAATPLPALDLRDGVPAELRTIVAVPTLLTTVEAIDRQIERLEVHHLASPEGELHFALLSDWLDAATEHVDGDAALLQAATAGIARLNRLYGPAPGGDRFLLLHRKRVWNASEMLWIGWERKRGKLHELNRLLRGAQDTGFLANGPLDMVPSETGGTSTPEAPPVAPQVPAGVRYVLTLDADTRLPRDTVHRLIGKMAHQLNRPRVDAGTGRIVAGYGVLQPRVTPSMPVGREGSLFQRAFSSMTGMDPYAAAVSDVYQDLFNEGSYAGKGIYDVDAFEAALAGRVPDSTLLSHDLFEGVFARAGLASDIEVVEEFPAHYDVDALRHHRWARGDWQLLPWMVGHAPLCGTDRTRQGIPAIGRWKMLDNLRRTLSAPACMLGLLLGFSLPFGAAPFATAPFVATPFADASIWTGFVLLTMLLPPLIPITNDIVPHRAGITLRSHLAALGADMRVALTQGALVVTLLAHQAWLMGDAIARTLWRLFVSHRHLLEWTSAAQEKIGRRRDLVGFYRLMAGAVALGVLAVPVSLLSRHGAWPLAMPLAALWIASPAIARWASRSPAVGGRIPVTVADAHALRLIARRTWRFFETFVTAADHMLPPDNFQEDPAPVVAHRTSPTNIGLYLLSVVTARDFAWLGTTEAAERLSATFATMANLARHRGHFYNWYDTGDLRPLDPQYVSTVDSGNLAGHLITLANACREWNGGLPAPARRLAGIGDALDLARAATDGLHDGRRTQTVTWHQLDDTLTALTAGVRRAAAADEDIADRLTDLAAQADNVADIATAFASERGDDTGADMVFWVGAARRAIESHRRDFAPSPAS